MAWCENNGCGRADLSSREVIYDDVMCRIVCLECFYKTHPQGEIKERIDIIDATREEWPVGYAIQLSKEGGLSAEVRLGDVSLRLAVPAHEISHALRGMTRPR
jgi:hypothetical protein